MPKIKTHSSSKKRFRKSKSGVIKYSKAFRRHILTKKSSKRKRHLRAAGLISKADLPRVTALLS